MLELGIMGGGFNPVHNSHILAALRARYQFSLGKVILIPSGAPPHKPELANNKEIRFNLLNAAIAGIDGLEVSRTELDREGQSLTKDTLKELIAQYGPNVRISNIIGEDIIDSLVKYCGRMEIFSRCRLLVIPRMSADASAVTEWRRKLPDAEIEAVDTPGSPLSSTLIRHWIASGQPYRFTVPDAVYKLIEEHGYYKPSALALMLAAQTQLTPSPASSDPSCAGGPK